MAKIKIYHDFSGVAQDILAIWYTNANPTAEIGRLFFNAPHVPGNFLIEGLEPVMHMVKFFQTADGVTPGAQVAYIDVDAGLYNEASVEFYEFTVGSGLDVGDGVHFAPADGTISYRNDKLASADVKGYTVNKPGYGELNSTIITKVAGGGFDLIDGSAFGQGEPYSLTVFKLLTTQATQTSTQNQFIGVKLFFDNINFDANHRNRLLVASLEIGIRSIFLPALNTIADNTVLHLNTHQTAHGVTIALDGSDSISFLGFNRNALHIGIGEEIRIVFKGGVGYIVHYEGDYRRVGQRIWGDKQELNTLIRNGSEYLLADYPRLVEWMDSLGVGQVVSYATWASSQIVTVGGNSITVYPYKDLFAISIDGLSFKVPDSRNRFNRALRFTDGTSDSERLVNVPGGGQGPQLLSHGHDISTTQSSISGQVGADPARGTTTGSVNTRGAAGTSKTIGLTGGSEERPENTGLIPLIVI